jgi:tetratricopeptide (TPR) repeat protein
MITRYISLITVVLMTSAAAAPPPLAMSLHPHEVKRPTDQLETKSDSAQARALIELLTCVDALAHAEFAEGEAACSRAIALNARDATAYKLRGYGYLLEHRFERAQTDFRTSLSLDPRDAESLAGYGESFSGQGKFPDAVAQFTKAIDLAPDKSAYLNARCWARAGEGKHLDRALADCDRALALSPGAPGVLDSRGLVRLRMG